MPSVAQKQCVKAVRLKPLQFHMTEHLMEAIRLKSVQGAVVIHMALHTHEARICILAFDAPGPMLVQGQDPRDLM